jgi:hypothetical protein
LAGIVCICLRLSGAQISRKYKKNIFLPPKTYYILPQKEADAVQFLIKPFTFLGLQGQNWMLIVIAMIAAYGLFAWKTGNWR